MARTWRQTHPLRMRDDYVEVVDDDSAVEYSAGLLANIVDTVGSVIVAALSIRFLLSLFGANTANAFANFMYNVTAPLIRPFVGLFGTDPRIGDARLEFETIAAIVLYGLLTIILARLVSLPRRDAY
jgi:YggT family protein